jgi:hypothetical protein
MNIITCRIYGGSAGASLPVGDGVNAVVGESWRRNPVGGCSADILVGDGV